MSGGLVLRIRLPADRDRAGTVEVIDARGRVRFAAVPAAGRASDEAARRGGNPTRARKRPYGDTPLGTYVVKDVRDDAIVLAPKGGEAAIAEALGRFAILIQGGPTARGALVATSGAVRVRDRDLARLIRLVRDEDIRACTIEEHGAPGAKVAQGGAVDEDPPALERDVIDRHRRKLLTAGARLVAGAAAGAVMLGRVKFVWAQAGGGATEYGPPPGDGDGGGGGGGGDGGDGGGGGGGDANPDATFTPPPQPVVDHAWGNDPLVDQEPPPPTPPPEEVVQQAPAEYQPAAQSVAEGETEAQDNVQQQQSFTAVAGQKLDVVGQKLSDFSQSVQDGIQATKDRWAATADNGPDHPTLELERPDPQMMAAAHTLGLDQAAGDVKDLADQAEEREPTEEAKRGMNAIGEIMNKTMTGEITASEAVKQGFRAVLPKPVVDMSDKLDKVGGQVDKGVKTWDHVMRFVGLDKLQIKGLSNDDDEKK